jgi:hypothetical protein
MLYNDRIVAEKKINSCFALQRLKEEKVEFKIQMKEQRGS